ncbi:MAG: acyl-CoA ligase (AMP-forming), exosortase A system-associated [Rhodothalassiaceae bacterium]
MRGTHMARFLADLICDKVGHEASRPALSSGRESFDYRTLSEHVLATASGLCAISIARHDRVAIWLDKRLETVAAMFGTAAMGGIFIPCNPVLKAPQIAHILKDSGARVLISSKSRIESLEGALEGSGLEHVIAVDSLPARLPAGVAGHVFSDLAQAPAKGGLSRPLCDNDVCAIFYTSGSTGRPKGVVLSHRNLVVGGESVAEYLGNHAGDSILSLLPLSFDAGFSQLTTAFHAGARVVLHNYLLARDVPRLMAREEITGLTAVPPLWIQLLEAEWPEEATRSLRYFANTGGRMPREVLGRLRATFRNARPFLMYGLTEAFRSTYLDPDEVDRRPDSIGKAIPNAEILVVKPDGTLAGPGEEGELVHRGPLVGLGYWNDPERTAERYKPVPSALAGVPTTELAVWSGDMVRLDSEGFLYFVGRNDEMIKTSGYRLSPTEIEEALHETGLVREAAAFGLPHPVLGQEVAVAIVAAPGVTEAGPVTDALRTRIPAFMMPTRYLFLDSLPRSPNGKIDRKSLVERIVETSSETVDG